VLHRCTPGENPYPTVLLTISELPDPRRFSSQQKCHLFIYCKEQKSTILI
jgi:hypothetical protein